MDQFKHFLHPHNLSFIDVGKDDDSVVCLGCANIIHGPAYSCRTCPEVPTFVMHESCAKLPPEIQRDALHPHPLRFNLREMIVCDGCGRLSASFFSYRCMNCEFSLDLGCAVAFSNADELKFHEALQEGGKIKTKTRHFSHNHHLTCCKFLLPTTEMAMDLFKEMSKLKELHCMACKQELQGTLTYTCLLCKFFIHESCINTMPTHVQSPFHPQHILLPRRIPKRSSLTCYACRDEVEGISFYCKECDVNLHSSCANYNTRIIKHNCHPHHLLYVGKSITTNISCDACPEKDRGDSFSCTECDFQIHVECISLPASVQHTRHLHPLRLVKDFVEDDSGNYYCDVCETERNPEHHVYYCEECNFIAHIDCVVRELEPTKEMFLERLRIEENSNQILELEGILMDGEKIIQNDLFHPHPLTLTDDVDAMFVCNGCGELRRGLSYNCSPCMFSLDTECAALKSSDELAKHEANKGRKIKTTISHFSHNHQLNRCKIDTLQTKLGGVYCQACRQDIGGLMYVCLLCRFFLHESCLKGMPVQVQSPFHPHPLRVIAFPSNDRSCDTCRENVDTIRLLCHECGVLPKHYSCAMYRTRELKHGCHDHRLQHLGKNIFVKKSPKCEECNEDCTGTLFCCTKCDFYIHLECIPLPHIVKHGRHLHQLTLTDKVIEDDTGNYYCDICETERNPEHDVYYCKECNFIAHIDCVLSEIEPLQEIFQLLVPRPKKKRPIDFYTSARRLRNRNGPCSVM